MTKILRTVFAIAVLFAAVGGLAACSGQQTHNPPTYHDCGTCGGGG